MKTVYVAGPYTNPDPIINTRNAITAGEELSQAGFIPYIPHLDYSWHLVFPHEPDFWYDYSMEWLRKCDCVLRLEGESYGADNEVIFAQSLRIPVYLSIKELINGQ